MKEGDEAWQFFARDHISDGACPAIDLYAAAYNIHPRNREAVAGLKKAADALLDATGLTRRPARRSRRTCGSKSIFYEKYAPVVDAVRE